MLVCDWIWFDAWPAVGIFLLEWQPDLCWSCVAWIVVTHVFCTPGCPTGDLLAWMWHCWLAYSHCRWIGLRVFGHVLVGRSILLCEGPRQLMNIPGVAGQVFGRLLLWGYVDMIHEYKLRLILLYLKCKRQRECKSFTNHSSVTTIHEILLGAIVVYSAHLILMIL